MVNSLNGISAADYQTYLQVQNQILQSGATNSINLTYQNDSVSFSGNKCTDGKDDGKIGFFSALGNAIEGAGKTVVNGLKGMVTGKDGKFSLGKTLLSLGTAAVCVAFPAVGLAACAIGGTMGAVQIGKGIYNAATAKTDAEAKQAWENIGGGALTVGMSYAGGKAAAKSVTNTSTAGLNSGSNQLAVSTPGNQLAQQSVVANSNVSTSALGNLPKNATFTQKMSALGKDMASSTKNNYANIRTTAQNYSSAAKWYKQGHEYAKQMKNNKNAIGDTATNSSYKNWVNESYNLASNEGTRKAVQNINSAYNIWTKAKGSISKANAQKLWTNFTSYIKSVPKEIQNINFSEMGKNLTGTASKIYSDMIDNNITYSQAVQKYGYENVAQVIQYMGGNIFGTEFV